MAIETAACYNFAPLFRKIKEEIKRDTPGVVRKSDIPEDKFRDIMFTYLHAFTINNQKFEYSYSPNHLGGERWFVNCPKCGKKCVKLYLPKANSKREQRYLCKICHRLKNASSLMGASRKYKEVIKPLKKLEKIKKLLIKDGMTAEKAAPLLNSYEKIEKELANSPVYRLWKFQQRYKPQK
jgi:hypothetical protein